MGQEKKYPEVGRRIAQARKEAGIMAQWELGNLLGLSERSIAAYEAGDVIPFRVMDRLAEILNVSPAWILHGDNDGLEGDMKEVLAALKELRAEVRGLRRDLKK